MKKNKLITFNDITTPESCRTIITNLSESDKAAMYDISKNVIAETFQLALRESLLASTINDKVVQYELNGIKKQMTITKGKERDEIVEKSTIDWEKVMTFAIKHNKSIYWIEQRTYEIIEKNKSFKEKILHCDSKDLNTNKMELETWFQENIDSFLIKTKETKKIKSTDKITIKDRKE